MKDYDIIYSIGIFLTFSVALINLFLTLKNNRKNIFINSVTNSRIKYIQEIRNNISEFCGIVHSYCFFGGKLDDKNLFDLQTHADKTKYLIRLYLNPEDKFWDEKIIKLLDEILELTDKNPTEKIDELILITQYLLKLEWEGAKLESEKGILKKSEKEKLYRKYVDLYQEAIKNL